MKIRQDAWTDENDLLLAETVLRHVREGSTQLNAFEEVGDKLNRTSAACGFRWNAVVRHNYEKALQLAKKQRKQRQRILGKDQSGKKKLLYSPPQPSFEDIDTMSSVEIPETIEMYNYEMAEDMTSMTSERAVMPDETAVMPSETPVMQDRNACHARLKQVLIRCLHKQLSMPSQTTVVPGTRLNLNMVIGYLQTLNRTILQAEILKSENERLKREMADLNVRNKELEGKLNDIEQNAETMQEDYETLMKIMNKARKLALFEEEERPATKFKMDRNGNLEKVAE